MLYLIHFSTPLKHARHYLGFCEEKNLASRLAYHRKGKGSKLLRAVAEAGIAFEVVRTFPDGTRSQERHLKNKKYGPRLCPVCFPENYIKNPEMAKRELAAS